MPPRERCCWMPSPDRSRGSRSRPIDRCPNRQVRFAAARCGRIALPRQTGRLPARHGRRSAMTEPMCRGHHIGMVDNQELCRPYCQRVLNTQLGQSLPSALQRPESTPAVGSVLAQNVGFVVCRWISWMFAVQCVSNDIASEKMSEHERLPHRNLAWCQRSVGETRLHIGGSTCQQGQRSNTSMARRVSLRGDAHCRPTARRNCCRFVPEPAEIGARLRRCPAVSRLQH